MSAAASGAIDRVAGHGIVIRGDDIDTDQIMPARFLKWITFAGMEAHVFEDARREATTAGRVHPFDVPRSVTPHILFVNRNFGCGSSREHAPQGLRRAGIGAIVGESFGEIFAGNCLAMGVPCVEVDADVAATLQSLCEERQDTGFTLDLHTMTISGEGQDYTVRLREGRRRQLLAGTWDSTALLLEAGDEIDRVLLA